MNEEIAKTVSIIIKTTFFIALGIALYYFLPAAAWVWIKHQAEWAVHLFKTAI